jgi:hypothetical protein
MSRPYAKQRLHNHKYFSFFSKVFAKAGTFFYVHGLSERGTKYIEKKVFLLLGRERKDRKQLSIDGVSCHSSRDLLV